MVTMVDLTLGPLDATSRGTLKTSIDVSRVFSRLSGGRTFIGEAEILSLTLRIGTLSVKVALLTRPPRSGDPFTRSALGSSGEGAVQ